MLPETSSEDGRDQNNPPSHQNQLICLLFPMTVKIKYFFFYDDDKPTHSQLPNNKVSYHQCNMMETFNCSPAQEMSCKENQIKVCPNIRRNFPTYFKIQFNFRPSLLIFLPLSLSRSQSLYLSLYLSPLFSSCSLPLSLTSLSLQYQRSSSRCCTSKTNIVPNSYFQMFFSLSETLISEKKKIWTQNIYKHKQRYIYIKKHTELFHILLFYSLHLYLVPACMVSGSEKYNCTLMQRVLIEKSFTPDRLHAFRCWCVNRPLIASSLHQIKEHNLKMQGCDWS